MDQEKYDQQQEEGDQKYDILAPQDTYNIVAL